MEEEGWREDGAKGRNCEGEIERWRRRGGEKMEQKGEIVKER